MAVIVLFLSLISYSVFGQNDTSKTFVLTPNAVLKDGVYFSYDRFLKQQPLPFVKILNYENYTDKESFFKQKNIQILDEYGIAKTIDTRTIWGYVLNNVLFVNYNKDFYRVSYLGTISHFLATQTVRNYATPYDPYYGYYSPYPMQTYETTNITQNIIDFKTGKIYPFSPEAMLALMADDNELFNEYNALKKKKKKEMIFYYLRKYNDKHPLILYK
ncbi:MAG: hypothetical protein HPY79_01195 [Bacteroidales bacterium]|nr:hypothetical protein [Bacteroidales bacterium]